MPIRPAVYSDLWPAAQVLAAGFKDNEVFGEYMHPHRNQYPHDMSLYFLQELRLTFCKGPSHHVLVSYQTNGFGEEECITGLAHWERLGQKITPSIYRSALLRMIATYNYLESCVYPNRAGDPLKMDVLSRAHAFTKHHWTGTRGNVYNLCHLAIDPKQHGKGFGRELVYWGLARAREEGCGLTVISAAGKEGFYKKCGFDVIVGTCRDEGGDANPLKDIPGGTIFFWDNGIEPQGVKKYGEA